jgi:hypothetical protein
VLAVELTLRVDVLRLLGEIATLVGFIETMGPDGETVADRLTVPLKTFWLDTVIVELPDDPCGNVMDPGLDETVKLGVEAVRTTKVPTIAG